MFQLRVDDEQTSELERSKNLTTSCASALRLLHASLSPLDPDDEHQEKYEKFLGSLDVDIIALLRLHDVIDFWRAAIGAPRSETILIVPLIDGAHAASGTFGSRPSTVVSGTVHSFPNLCCLKLCLAECEKCTVVLDTPTAWVPSCPFRWPGMWGREHG